jgi:hypothetical protein
MGRREPDVLPPYDFSAAEVYQPAERLEVAIEQARRRLIEEGAWDLHGIPPVPDRGASVEELAQFEQRLGRALPREYRLFLSRWRYLAISSGLQIWGLDHDGVSIGAPWVSKEHRQGCSYLVLGDYCGYADGDQLIIDTEDPEERVAVYLHEHGPRYEPFAPSLSLAVWRMVHEPL